MFQPRHDQKNILAYRGGWMGIIAVPGSGKTWTLSRMAAEIIARGQISDDQEVLVVTLVNSAVDNFQQRVQKFLSDENLLPSVGFRVRTLHGLAHDIVRERPGLLGLDEKFQIIDERDADAIRLEVAQAWLRAHPFELDDYLDPEIEDGRRGWLLREKLPDQIRNLALIFIRSAKDNQLTPQALREKLDQLPLPLPLASIGLELYEGYQQALNYRGAVDFDDLIRLALSALERDEEYLLRLRMRWPFILEDEAQDSSRLQERILSLLAGPDGNWVRVGDPNQAIYETFTTANPKYLRQFSQQPGVIHASLPVSGRSSPAIIRLANQLVRWTQAGHPLVEARDALQGPPFIEAAPPGDPQPNPADLPSAVYIHKSRLTPQEELERVGASLARWLPDHPEETAAVLVPRNERGADVVSHLQQRGLPVVDLLRSSSSTRKSARVLSVMLEYLANPKSPALLAEAFRAWQGGEDADEESQRRANLCSQLIRRHEQVETLLWPEVEPDWLAQLQANDPAAFDLINEFRQYVQRWQGAALLPVDQLILALSQDLLTETTELAVAHKLAQLLRRADESNPSWRLPELTGELKAIANNQRRFLGFGEGETEFDPAKYRGKVVVATIHKAKGLEFDRVYLMSLNNYDFPAGQANDRFISERWYFRDSLNLEAETLAQLELITHPDPYTWYQEGQATLKARIDYVRERLRLLYVGITRARKEVLLTWNTGRQGELNPTVGLVALHHAWQSGQDGQDLSAADEGG